MLALILVLLLIVVLAWPVGLVIYANGRMSQVSALSGAADTEGTTYLIAGSDERAEDSEEQVEGARTDTVMVLHRVAGTTTLLSLPRDTYVEIPGVGFNKLNAAYTFGGPATLTATVENLTGLTVDHYVEIGMDGVEQLVDAVGGVELCLDYDVDDWRSGLDWQAGCHHSDGATALAFSRMRYSDPLGDIGRAERQRQVVGAVLREATQPATLVNPLAHVRLVNAGTDVVTTDEGSGVVALGQMALALRAATGENGQMGTPPIASYDYRPGGIGSAVQLDPERTPGFFERLRTGDLTADDLAPSF
ncbi:LCP family protein [Bogoriella caseilytica]|uniref:LytR family transcriptional attenuator n=1 Tax=Bogoriella caseilytica TaxID=56055 RepID=A0A3N2BA10_9MICO|nr:LCP family protein [Bogoriella caseilytica]ROR72110.1 LytR family transcriptional attenuator [Bogoriella caseilytica]